VRPSELGLPSKFTEFRNYPGFDQLDCAARLATNPERFQILNAPTGCGKSLLYSTVAALLKARVLVLVGTKGLQSQLLDDGLVERLIYGHRNYPCAARTGGFGLEDADADDPEYRCAVPRDRCGYLPDVAAAAKARSVVANYAYWLSIGRYSDPDLLGEFDLLVMDESHGAADWLGKSLSIYMSPGRLRRYLKLSSPSTHSPGYPALPRHREIGQWYEWARDMLALALDRFSGLGREEKIERRKLGRLIDDLGMLLRVSAPGPDPSLREPWIVIPQEDGAAVQFAPRWGSDFAEQYLFRGIPRVLLTSATITRQHATYLGIPDGEMRHTEVPSPFDVRRRPIVWIPTTRVDYRMSDGQRWKLRQRVDEVITAAIEQGAGNGVVHTGSYDRNREIASGSRFTAAIITHRQDSKDFQAALERFKQAGRTGKFAVIASPRMQEGVDLADDLGRWAVVLKVPFPDSRDPLTRARLENPSYRDLVVMEVVMQMCGRHVRGAGDFGTTVILDDHWGQHVQWQCPFPGWFKAAFRTLKKDEKIQFLTRESVDRLPPVRQVQLIG
jgi:Rad3-related DNA helicase